MASKSQNRVRIVKNSVLRYSQMIEETDNDGQVYQFWEPIDIKVIEESDTDVQYRVVAGDTIDALAKQFYGDSHLLWVIKMANDIVLPEVELSPGVILRIPDRRRVLNEILKGG